MNLCCYAHLVDHMEMEFIVSLVQKLKSVSNGNSNNNGKGMRRQMRRDLGSIWLSGVD